MKKSFMLLAVAMLAFAGSAMAQNSASIGGKATAWAISPISIQVSTCPLAFGNVIGSAAGGTVGITASATPTITYNLDGNLRPGTQVGTRSAACFCASGEGGFSVDISNTAGQIVPITMGGTPGTGFTNTINVTLTGPSGGTNQLLSGTLHDGDAFTDPADAGSGADPINQDGTEDNGTLCWFVGGTLTLQAAPLQATPGNYTGSWTETVSYH